MSESPISTEETRELLKQYSLDPDEFLSDPTPSKVIALLLHNGADVNSRNYCGQHHLSEGWLNFGLNYWLVPSRLSYVGFRPSVVSVTLVTTSAGVSLPASHNK
ncbi:hypothetical protein L6452_40262 [Arctium lappa]|uniref:Uncharacterized protein n=1 Tax=Arctium lappa TaxID=4217 RepID=A0ACB8XLZ7_ARCLA|nr:hypothetical protein L6452_40262 [Arctium lappa]